MTDRWGASSDTSATPAPTSPGTTICSTARKKESTSARSTCRPTASSCRTGSSSRPSARGANRTRAWRRFCRAIERCIGSISSSQPRMIEAHMSPLATGSLPTRSIRPFEVSAIGLGCMNLIHAYGVPPPPHAAEALLRRALELGITLFDTAALYGFGENEELLGRVLAPHRREINLASKCGMTGVQGKRVIEGRPETLRRTCDESLRRLRTDVIDLYYLHRWDRAVPIEDSVGALSDLVRAGKVRAIGLSEVSAATCATPPRWPRATSAARCLASSPKRTRPTCSCWTNMRHWRRRQAARRHNWRSPGCWPAGRMWCRFPAPRGSGTWRTTWVRQPSA